MRFFWRKRLHTGGHVTEEEFFEAPPDPSLTRKSQVTIPWDAQITEEEYFEPGLSQAGRPSKPSCAVQPNLDCVRPSVNNRVAEEPSTGLVKSSTGQQAADWDADVSSSDVEADLRRVLICRPGVQVEEWIPPPPGLPGTPPERQVSKLAIRLRLHPCGMDCPPVTFKHEGSKFKKLGNCDTTLKLRTNVEYFIGIKVVPPVPIRGHMLDLTVFSSERGEESGKPYTVVKLHLTPTREGYYTTWRCDLPTCVDGERRRLMASLDAMAFGRVNLPVLAKVYEENDRKSSLAGTPLGALYYEWRNAEGPDEPSLTAMEALPIDWDMRLAKG